MKAKSINNPIILQKPIFHEIAQPDILKAHKGIIPPIAKKNKLIIIRVIKFEKNFFKKFILFSFNHPLTSK